MSKIPWQQSEAERSILCLLYTSLNENLTVERLFCDLLLSLPNVYPIRKQIKPKLLSRIHIYSAEYDERYPENNLDTILTDDPLNDSLIEEIKSIPGEMCIRDRIVLVIASVITMFFYSLLLTFIALIISVLTAFVSIRIDVYKRQGYICYCIICMSNDAM